VIEPYISTIHFVHNHEGMDSRVLGISVDEYMNKKEYSSSVERKI